MATFIALTHTEEHDWSQPEYEDGLREYVDFEEAHADVLRGGHALYPTASAKLVRAPDGDGEQPVVSDGPFAETKEVLTGFFLIECADMDEAVEIAAKIPAVQYGTVEVRQLHSSLGV
ncbi:hypothetical protein CLV30_11168 [Haloactinopolyspora alba]|uniref:YCII-related domain-containing protein n=1 Tax=Haloactinopolyspora alba TaxID=648780 RepID=A0A2P8DY50_9ACTN|nr:YciI family protein [Haloactinopolyspora alba]PSL02113.1 hypothetical protein CLV30_11168 [Haloactinopolyspora alba]